MSPFALSVTLMIPTSLTASKVSPISDTAHNVSGRLDIMAYPPKSDAIININVLFIIVYIGLTSTSIASTVISLYPLD